MRKANDLTDIMNIAYASKYNLSQLAASRNKPVQIILHWTAGRYNQFFDDYHINIDSDGSYILTTEDFSEVKSHNWMKNTGSIAICLCCAYNANTNNLGDYPPTNEQIEAMAKVIAVITKALDIPIDIHHVCSHGTSADNEDYVIYFPDYTGYRNNTYGPKSTCERWDLEYLGTNESPSFDPYNQSMRGDEVIRQKAKKYRMSFYDD